LNNIAAVFVVNGRKEQAPLTEQLEHQLLRQAQMNDPDAFEQLQMLLEGAVRRFIRRLIGSGDAEDDIAQNVFIALYFNVQNIDPVENLRPYLFRIVRNCCYDELRRQRRYDVFSLDDDAISVSLSFTSASDINSQPEEAAHWLLLHLEVKEAIERLPELQRQTLILFSEEDLSYGEIAIVMDTNIGTVKSRLHHAKKTLRRLLRPETIQALEVDFQRGESDV
jgi:RNA polymerase sigma-70 factor, ECF subfamily